MQNTKVRYITLQTKLQKYIRTIAKVYLQSYDTCCVVKLQPTTQLFLLDGKLLTENFYITPSNQYQPVLISTTHIYVLLSHWLI